MHGVERIAVYPSDGRRQLVQIPRLVGLEVFLEVVLASKRLFAHAAGVRFDARVDALVPRELLVAREFFAAARLGALERSLAYTTKKKRTR